MRKILITGINGFIGQHLAKSLIQRGHIISGIGRKEECLIEEVSEYFQGDILDKQLVEKATESAEIIIHLAAPTQHEEIVNNKFNTLETNFLGTKNLLGAFSKSKNGKKFIYSSTGKVYGDIQFLPITEHHPTNPLNILGKSKLITEKLIDFYSNNEKDFIILRIFNVFGAGQKESFLIPTILNQIKNSDEINLGDIKAKRDYIHIQDVVDAFVTLIESKTEHGLSIFNICSGKGLSAEEIVAEIDKILNRKTRINSNIALVRKDEKDVEYGSYSKMDSCFGWKPVCSLTDYFKEALKE